MSRRVLSLLALPVGVSVSAAAAGFQVGAPAGRRAWETRLRGGLRGITPGDPGVRGGTRVADSLEGGNMI